MSAAMPAAETEARIHRPVTRENLHQFATFKMVEGCVYAPAGGIYSLALDEGDDVPLFRHVAGPGPLDGGKEVYLCLHQMAGIDAAAPAPQDNTAVLKALDDAALAIAAARAALTASAAS